MLARFVEQSPITVMAQLTLRRALEPGWIDELFEEHRQRPYTRQLLFSTTVDLGVSLAALYDKLNHTEPELVRALVQGNAQRLEPVLAGIGNQRQHLVKGYRVRIIDGNHLPASEKRLKPLRNFRGAALPGQALVVYDPDEGLVIDMLPCEDGHTQERALMAPILAAAQAGELWIADRNFSTKNILFGWDEQGAAFIVREHGQTPNPSACGRLRKVGRIESAVVYEQAVKVEREDGSVLHLRRVELHLETPTEEGDTVIRLLSNLPARMKAGRIASLYRQRWSIEGMFQRLEAVLQSEISTLGYPRAALLALGVAVVAYNVLCVLQTAVERQHELEPYASTHVDPKS